DLARGVVGLRIFDRRIGEPATAVIALGRALGQPLHIPEQLGTRVIGMLVLLAIEALPERILVVAQIFRGKFVLGRVAAIQAGLGDACAGDDLVDTDGTDTLAVKQLLRGLPDAIGGAEPGWFGD